MENGGNGARHFDVHGALSIKLVGRGPVSEIIARTLGHFESAQKDPQLTLFLGEYPSREWEPKGTLVGDRFLYDHDTLTTTVFGNRVKDAPLRSEVEYVLIGNLLSTGKPVTVYVPNLRKPVSVSQAFRHDLWKRHLRRAILDAVGNPYALKSVVRQAERITEAIIEPFLYYRLPEKGLTFVHAAAICSDGDASIFAGSANIGKSTFVIRSVRDGLAFIGDTLVILAKSGEVLSYPGLIKLHGGHLTSFPELGKRLTAGLGPITASLLTRDLASSPREALESLPQPEMSDLFKDVSIPMRCRLQTAVLVRRGSQPSSSCERIDPDRLGKDLSADLHWEFEKAPWRSGQFIYSASTIQGEDDLPEIAECHAKVDDVIQAGISNAECFKVSLPFGAPVRVVEDMVPEIREPKKTRQ